MIKWVKCLAISVIFVAACDNDTPINTPVSEEQAAEVVLHDNSNATAPTESPSETQSATSLTINGQPYTLPEAKVRLLGGNVVIEHGNPKFAAPKLALKDGEALLSVMINGKEVLSSDDDFEPADIKSIEQFRIGYKQNGEVKDFYVGSMKPLNDKDFKWSGKGTGGQLTGVIESINEKDGVRVKYVYNVGM